MLRDSAHIQEFEAEWRNRKEDVPVRSLSALCDGRCRGCDQSFRSMWIWRTASYLRWGGNPFTDVSICWRIQPSIESGLPKVKISRKIVFSGDGNVESADHQRSKVYGYRRLCGSKSTYGNRVHSLEKIDYVSEFENFERNL